jgi:hypothetical protein
MGPASFDHIPALPHVNPDNKLRCSKDGKNMANIMAEITDYNSLIRNALCVMANQSNKFTCIAEIYSMLIKSIPETFDYITQNFKGILINYDYKLCNLQNICDKINSKSSDDAIAALKFMLYLSSGCSKDRLNQARQQFSNISIMV